MTKGMILTLTQTVERAKAGEKDAFAELYGHYHKELYRYAYYALRHEQDAQDAVAETVASAFAQIKKLKKAESFPMWIFKILSNQIKRKKKQYVKEHTNLLPLEEVGETVEEAVIPPEDKMDLFHALQQIPEKARQIVILSVVDGFTSQEIAAILDMKPTTVRSKLSRTLKQLEQLLTPNDKGR